MIRSDKSCVQQSGLSKTVRPATRRTSQVTVLKRPKVKTNAILPQSSKAGSQNGNNDDVPRNDNVRTAAYSGPHHFDPELTQSPQTAAIVISLIGSRNHEVNSHLPTIADGPASRFELILFGIHAAQAMDHAWNAYCTDLVRGAGGSVAKRTPAAVR